MATTTALWSVKKMVGPNCFTYFIIITFYKYGREECSGTCALSFLFSNCIPVWSDLDQEFESRIHTSPLPTKNKTKVPIFLFYATKVVFTEAVAGDVKPSTRHNIPFKANLIPKLSLICSAACLSGPHFISDRNGQTSSS